MSSFSEWSDSEDDLCDSECSESEHTDSSDEAIKVALVIEDSDNESSTTENNNDATSGCASEQVTPSSSSQAQQETSKPTWNGLRLFPPSGKTTSSPAWRHEGFLKDKSSLLNKSHVICCYCGKTTPIQRFSLKISSLIIQGVRK